MPRTSIPLAASGGGLNGGARTHCLVLPRHALYQLSYIQIWRRDRDSNPETLSGSSVFKTASLQIRLSIHMFVCQSRSLIAFSMRSFAMLKYLSSSSMPMKLRPVFTQATPVVPLPINGSRTMSPAFEEFVTNVSIIESGFSVTCSFPLFCVGISTQNQSRQHISLIGFALPFRKNRISSQFFKYHLLGIPVFLIIVKTL